MKKYFSLFLLLTVCAAGYSQATNKIETTGDIGIGTVSPAYKLDVRGVVNAGNSSIGGFYRLEGKDGYTYPWRILNTTVAGLQLASENGIGGATFLDNGNVGIGNSSPVYRLDVQGTVSAGTTANGGILRVEGKAGYAQAWQLKTSSMAGLQFAADNGIGTVSFLDNGNVGVGTTAASQLLTLKGTTANLIEFQNSAGTGTGYIGQAYAAGQVITNSSVGDMVLRTESKKILFTSSSNAKAEMAIANGNVGIGTIDPSEKLSVNGNIVAKKIKITQTGWSDYVFNKDYNLRSLSSLKYYIRKNRHLPEVPSTEEVEKHGISVGETQALLLKKIEELTLYVIEISEENRSQQKQLELQAKEIQKLKQMK